MNWLVRLLVHLAGLLHHRSPLFFSTFPPCMAVCSPEIHQHQRRVAYILAGGEGQLIANLHVEELRLAHEL